MIKKVCKLLTCIVVALIIMVFSHSNVRAIVLNKINYNFNEITEAESIDFVTNYNIAIPSRLVLMQKEGIVTKEIIQNVYNNSNYVFAYSYDAMQKYANSIKQVLLDYYVLRGANGQNRYALQCSTVKDSNGNWVTNGGYYDSSWYDYNCYAYSIRRNEASPFYLTYFQYQPGDMADDESGPNAINTFYDCSTISDLAELVEKDLLAMGYSSITISDSLPTVNSSQELICVRMGDEDYHFMHYDQFTESWYHKPGHTAVLKYNYNPSNSYIWNNECSYDGVEYPGSIDYDSNIKFIRYNKNVVNISANTSNMTYYLSINAGKDSILEINNTINNVHYNFAINSSYLMNVELYDANMTVLYSNSGSSVTFLRMLPNNRYYLKINYSNPNIYGSVTIGIAHIHDYDDHYQWKNATEHKSYCECGNYITDFHIVSPDAFQNGNLFATCLLCNGLARFGGIIHEGIGNYPYTLNGSFILPNGIIVLVDEDFEAYMNGTLVFIDPNENIDRSNTNVPFILRKEDFWNIKN